MQIMPTFAYLAPLTLLFGIGAASAAIATLIYAMPPAIRITALGHPGRPGRPAWRRPRRSGRPDWQVLAQGPAAARATDDRHRRQPDDHDGPLDGRHHGPHRRARARRGRPPGPAAGQRRGWRSRPASRSSSWPSSLDRLTDGPASGWTRASGARTRRAPTAGVVPVAAGAAVVLAVVAARDPGGRRRLPGRRRGLLRRPGQRHRRVRSRTTSRRSRTRSRTSSRYGLLNPLESVLTTAPWWLIIGVVIAVAWFVVRACGRPSSAAACLAIVAAMGLWEHGMQTLATVLVATALTLVIGLVLGILSARSDRFRPCCARCSTRPRRCRPSST